MSNKEFEKYKILYTEFIDQFMVLYNAHLQFLKTKGRVPAYDLRRAVRQIQSLAVPLKKQNQAAVEENNRNIKELRKLKKEKGRKNGHNSTTTKII